MAKAAPHSMDLPAFVKPAELSAEDLADRQALVELCTGLARSILQNSYYSPDHPQARRVVERPYALIQQLADRHQELTFIVTSWNDDETMALDGVFSEPIPLDVLIGGTAGEHFAAKLATFSKRNHLVSFSIKNTIREEEFHRFVTIFVERHINMDALNLLTEYEEHDGGPPFTDQLIEHNVVNVTIVLEEDLVEERRRLPWRVKVAMSRLRKDLRNIPIYSKATEAELMEAKLRLIRDILRPLRKGVYLKQLFLNLDLIEEEVEEFHELNLEPDLIDALPIDRQMNLAEALLAEHERLTRHGLAEHGVEQRPDLEETIKRQLELIGKRLGESQTEESATTLLRQLYELGAIPITALPRNLADRVRLDRWTASFLTDPPGFLELFDHIENAEAYLQHLPNVVAMFPNLLKLKQFESANLIIEMLKRHHRQDGGFAGRRELVDRALATLDMADIFAVLVQGMKTEPHEIRAWLQRMLTALGPVSVPHLIRVIEESDVDDVASDASLTLVALGPEAGRMLLDVLASRKVTRKGARYVLKVLGELGPPIGTREAAQIVAQYARHPAPLVRDGALDTATRIWGLKATPVLLRALDDEEPAVVCRAINLLSRLGVDDEDLILCLLGFLDYPPDEMDGRTPTPEPIQLAAVHALERMGNIEIEDLGSLESQLLEALGPPDHQVLGFLRRDKVTRNESVRAALCDALGEIGGEDSLGRLGATSKESSPTVRDHMSRASHQIRQRMET